MRSRIRNRSIVTFAWLVAFAGTAYAAGVPANVAAIVEARCVGCHGGDKPESGVKLDGECTA